MEKLENPFSKEFNGNALVPWLTDDTGRIAGMVKSAGPCVTSRITTLQDAASDEWLAPDARADNFETGPLDAGDVYS